MIKNVFLFFILDLIVATIISSFIQISFSIIVVPIVVGISTAIFLAYSIYLYQIQQKLTIKDVLIFYIVNEVIFMIIRKEPVLMGFFDKEVSSFHNENILISSSSLISIVILSLIERNKK